jgi:hypothetical protein
MGIIFEPTRESYTRSFQSMLDKYFLGKSFDSLESAMNREYEPGHLLAELFEVSTVTLTFVPANLPVSLDKAVTEVPILWRNFGKLPVLKAKYVEP